MLAQIANDTIRKLALPKPIPEEAQLDLKFKPFKINKAALHYKGMPQCYILWYLNLIWYLLEPDQIRESVKLSKESRNFTSSRCSLTFPLGLKNCEKGRSTIRNIFREDFPVERAREIALPFSLELVRF